MSTAAEQPAFLRVYRAVADDIAAGRLRVGDRLPTERVLGQQLGVSRATVRRAIAELARARPRGASRSAAARSWPATSCPSRRTRCSASRSSGSRRGLEASSPLLERERAARVDPGGRRVRHRDRARRCCACAGCGLLDDEPIAVDEALVPLELVPRRSLTPTSTTLSLYAELEAAGVEPTTAEYDVMAIAVHDPDATLLGLAPGTPALLAHTRSRDDARSPAGGFNDVYRGDRYRFQAILTRPPSFRRGRNT